MNAKVLIVDDSALTRRSLRHILETAGCEVLEVEDGLSAMERYFIERPDVVFLDLVMRGMYGLEVLQKLRELDPGARIIVVSADIQDSSHGMAVDAGAKGFVNKPFDKGDILAALESALPGASDR